MEFDKFSIWFYNMTMKAIDLKGKTFTRLTVIEKADNIGKKTAWLCKCSCGNSIVVMGTSLVSGNTKSCGCLHKEQLVDRNYKHGERHTKLYKVWLSMKERALNPKYKATHKAYSNVRLCEEWKDYEAFSKWAKSNGYKEGLSIDRINVYGNYEPSNCRWADRVTQQNNTTRNRFIHYKGDTKTLAQWAKILRINYHSLFNRLYTLHWSVDKAFETGVSK